ncbi:molybdate ABC transporter substrate-binding protein [Oceanobacillus salinisoli]|uniref:molybdate ABC transporter substrate-binding protein n=1 Tax=Oceanobacillus salinisoli TaxID=2678611 RepID=UPI001E452528|nr:molybdate ABC transporter substrate-binding protein [Oceanobacillus salinisoli]
MIKRIYIHLMICLLILAGCSSNNDSSKQIKLTISAASSMTESLIKLKEDFEREYPTIDISYNFGGSGSLRKQIEQGAPINLFLSASNTDYEKLVDQNMVEGTAILTNEIALILSNEINPPSFDKFLKGDGTLAIGTPEAVPAGTYSKEILQNLGVWDVLQDRMIYTKDVSQVVTLVSQGAAGAGMVYASDIIDVENVTHVETFDSSLHAPIEYFAAIIKNEEQSEDVKEAIDVFYQFIQAEEANHVFKKYRFQTVK